MSIASKSPPACPLAANASLPSELDPSRLTAAKGPYEYRPLRDGAIRVLDLLPGAVGDGLRLVIRHENFGPHDIPPYNALSYTWGSMKKTGNVIVQSQQNSEDCWEFPVTENLSVALNHLRSATEVRTLWIDAVCINQCNLAERQIQVARMDVIYRLAQRVIVWLGPEDEDSSLALQTLERVGNTVEVDWLTRNLRPLPGCETRRDELGRIATMGHAFSRAQLRAVISLLRRQWFTRLWIRQEIGLADRQAATVVCGGCTVLWEAFEKGGWLLYSSRFRTAEPLHAEEVAELSAGVKVLVDVIEGSRPGLALGHLFSLCRRAKCADPRDRIYANLSLIDAQDRKALGILPDYTMDTAAVYWKFAVRALEVAGGEILRYCVTPTSVPGLPSWAPDWSVQVTPVWFSTLSSASMGSGESVHVDGSRLKCAGAMCSTLSDVLPPLDLERIDDGQVVKYLRDLCNGCPGDYDTYKDRAKAFWGVLGARDFAELRIPPRGYNLSLEACVRSLEPDNDTGYDAATLRTFLKIYPPNRRIAYTRDKHICLVPETAQPGDEVWDLIGVGSLMVLRPASKITYEVIGEAWADGYCSNEALLGPLPYGFEPVRALPKGQRVSVPAMRENSSGDVRLIDPRLGRLPGFQQRIKTDGLEEAKYLLGSVTPELLRASGVDVREITLV